MAARCMLPVTSESWCTSLALPWHASASWRGDSAVDTQPAPHHAREPLAVVVAGAHLLPSPDHHIGTWRSRTCSSAPALCTLAAVAALAQHLIPPLCAAPVQLLVPHLLQCASLVALAVVAAYALHVDSALAPLRDLVLHQPPCGLACRIVQHLHGKQRNNYNQRKIRPWFSGALCLAL